MPSFKKTPFVEKAVKAMLKQWEKFGLTEDLIIKQAEEMIKDDYFANMDDESASAMVIRNVHWQVKYLLMKNGAVTFPSSSGGGVNEVDVVVLTIPRIFQKEDKEKNEITINTSMFIAVKEPIDQSWRIANFAFPNVVIVDPSDPKQVEKAEETINKYVTSVTVGDFFKELRLYRDAERKWYRFGRDDDTDTIAFPDDRKNIIAEGGLKKLLELLQSCDIPKKTLPQLLTHESSSATDWVELEVQVVGKKKGTSEKTGRDWFLIRISDPDLEFEHVNGNLPFRDVSFFADDEEMFNDLVEGQRVYIFGKVGHEWNKFSNHEVPTVRPYIIIPVEEDIPFIDESVMTGLMEKLLKGTDVQDKDSDGDKDINELLEPTVTAKKRDDPFDLDEELLQGL